MNTRVLVTGLGAISPLGVGSEANFDAAAAARSGVRRAPDALVAGLADLLVAPAAAQPHELLQRRDAALDRATQFALVAAGEAMADAGLHADNADGERFGVFVGIGSAGATTIEQVYTRYHRALLGSERERRSATVVHPLLVPRMMANAAMAELSIRYRLRGVGNTCSVACASSALAAGEALRAIRGGWLDAALVVGTEAMLTGGAMVAWNALRVMARPVAADPATSCRPFAADRSGFVIGEGAAALVLESAQRARRRGAAAHAELAGFGASNDATHLTLPDTAGQVAAMRQALDDSGLLPRDIGYLNAHGTATEAGDVVETRSIVEVFGDDAQRLAVSSTKAVHGHLIGASGALELLLAILAMRHGVLPPTAHLEHPDPRCHLDYVPLQARRGCRVDAVMSNAFAFGGSNAVLVARRAPELAR